MFINLNLINLSILCSNLLVTDRIYLKFITYFGVLISLFRMPSKAWKKRICEKDRIRNKVSSERGSDNIIPNCPLQGKKEITGIHGTLRRTRTYPEYSGHVGSNGSGRSF